MLAGRAPLMHHTRHALSLVSFRDRWYKSAVLNGRNLDITPIVRPSAVWRVPLNGSNLILISMLALRVPDCWLGCPAPLSMATAEGMRENLH